MAKIALVVLFSSMLVLSIQSTVGDDDEDEKQNASEYADATGERLVSSLDKAAEKVKNKAASLTEWAEAKLKGKSSSPKKSPPSDSSQAPSFPRAFGPTRLVPMDDGLADSDSGGQEDTSTNEGGLLPPTSTSRPFGPGAPTQIDSGGLLPQDLAPETAIGEGGSIPQDMAPETATGEGGSIPQDLAPGMPTDESGIVPQELAPGMPVDEGGIVPQGLAPGMPMDESGIVPQDLAPGMALAIDQGGLIAPGMPLDLGGLTAADMPSGEGGSAADAPQEEAPEN
ncbi:hypothetical protein V6N13_103412 [Hibiscus sabdariffa]|uniref:Uncharacterized protein n=2 Tax=Hibiscus sabdariffa TaxID=183260 RepID=A0ABR2BHJ1_9ROSI